MTAKQRKNRAVEVAPPSPRAPTSPEPVTPPERPDPVERFRRRAGWVILQVLFGASIFVLTKAHYDRPAKPPAGGSRVPAVAPAPAPAPPSSLADGNASSLGNDQLLQRAVSAFRSQDFVTAAGFYEQLVKRDASNPDILNNYALVLHYTGKSEPALRQLRSALNLNPQHQRSWLTLGFIHKGAGRTGDAREALEQAITIDKGNALATEARRMLAEL